MNDWIAKRLLSDAHVAVRGAYDSITDAILRTLLLNTDDAILVTGLDHTSLACNERFGEYFEVDPQAVVGMGVEELRSVVYPRLQDPGRWVRQLDEIYAEPELTYQDEMELIGEHPLILHRTTGPVKFEDGRIVGRLWKFRDVTLEKYREKLRDVLYEVSTFHDPDPTVVLRHVVQQIANVYGAISILSIREGKRMVFREVFGMPPEAGDVRENLLKEAYCKVTMGQPAPLIVQNGGNDPRFRRILPVRLGFTRYLGANIRDGKGRPIGTICLLDDRSSVPLTPEDSQFVSMMAIRIETELERERFYMERTADQRAMLERQRRELDATHSVLSAMNSAFEQAGGDRPIEAIVEAQIRLLKGLLGYDAAAILLPGDDGLCGMYTARRSQSVKPMRLADSPWVQNALATGLRFEGSASCAIATRLHVDTLATSGLTLGDGEVGLLVLGRLGPAPLDDEHHQVHLSALVEQVALLLAANRLNQRLLQTHATLRATQGQLVQSEKLSVVGTLAASVAHDIRNILSSLQLECSFGAADPAASLARVQEQLERFSLLAHQLLSYAKPRLLARESTDMNALLERAVNMVGPQMRVTHVGLEWCLADELPPVMADPNQVEHLFVNLILNAIQAMHAKGGSLRIATVRTPGGSEVCIRDTGGGIAPERLAKLFQPFQTSRANGFGLGLYSCGRIAAEHGWRIDVDSEVGVGTTFRVVIPRDRS